MLRHLYIKNFTLIDTLDMDFHRGFSVITGETGAGKSIILGAIGLLMGQRADTRSIKSGCDRCIVEARFDIAGYDIEQVFEDNDIVYDADECIIRRELTAAGKSRAFINDSPVALNTMRTIGGQLMDVHSQHQNLLLSEEDFQLNVVDIIAKNAALIAEYRQSYAAYVTARKAVESLKSSIADSRKDEDYMRFLLNELEEAHLSPGMQELLETESETLSHVEDIKTALFIVDNTLSDGDTGIVGRLRECTRQIADIKAIYPDINELSERIDSCYIELKDIAREVGSDANDIEDNPGRLKEISDALDTIYTLEQKHHVTTVEELIAIHDTLSEKVGRIDNSDEELRLLTAREAEALALCRSLAAGLTASRTAAAKTVEREMSERLVTLGIPHVRFAVEIEEKPLCDSGCDRLSFLFSANTGSPMQPIARVASGGEIARVMLSLKAMISGAVKLPTIIFDEIDTGVSGKVAERMAVIMRTMGENERQVISITHLPQIAARGTTHYKVYKEESPAGTTSRMTLLSPEERVNEIAQMLSGTDITAAAIDNAKELLCMDITNHVG